MPGIKQNCAAKENGFVFAAADDRRLPGFPREFSERFDRLQPKRQPRRADIRPVRNAASKMKMGMTVSSCLAASLNAGLSEMRSRGGTSGWPFSRNRRSPHTVQGDTITREKRTGELLVDRKSTRLNSS